MAKKKADTRIELAARIYGCEVGDLMGQHEFEDGSVAIIAPTGQKFTYPADRLREEMMKPEEAAPAEVEAMASGECCLEVDDLPERMAEEEEPGRDGPEDCLAAAIIKENNPGKASEELEDDHGGEERRPTGRRRRRR